MSKILSLEHISKQYPGVKALSDVSLSFETGEIHAIMGENGAGKSTLIKIIAGAVKSDGGTVTVGDRQITNMTPSLARECGIGVIYQEFNLVPSLSAARNICLGDREGSGHIPRTGSGYRSGHPGVRAFHSEAAAGGDRQSYG